MLSRGITSIPDNAFKGCSSLVEIINLPTDLQNIPISAFQNCTNLTLERIIDHVKTIGNFAFENTNLIIDEIPESVTSIGQQAFSGCNSIENLTIKGNPTFGFYTFQNCKGLTTLDMPNVTTTTDKQFEGCTSLESVNAPKLERIGWRVFYGCTNLINVDTAPLTALGSYAFYNCPSLVSIGALTNITKVDTYTFWNCNKLEIDLPTPLTAVGSYAFFGCKNIKNVTISGDVKVLGTYNFSEANIENLTIEEGVLTIKDRAFYKANIGNEIFTLPKSLETLETLAFQDCGINNLTLDNPNLRTIQGDVFRLLRNTDTVEIISLKEGCSISNEAFSRSPDLKKFKINDDVVATFGTGMFRDNVSMTDLYLGDSITMNSNSHMCYNCHELSNIKFNKTLIEVSSNAFSYCYKLLKVDFSNTDFERLYHHSAESFSPFYKTDLIEMNLASERFKRIDSGYYYGLLKNLKKVTLPYKRMEHIANDTFKYVDEITLPFEGIDSISRPFGQEIKRIYNLNKCDVIQKLNEYPNLIVPEVIILKEGVTELTYDNFYNSKSIKSIILPSTLLDLGPCRGLRLSSSFVGFYYKIYFKSTLPPSNIYYANHSMGLLPKFEQCSIYVPEESLEAYKGATNWKDYSSQIVGYDPATLDDVISQYDDGNRSPETEGLVCWLDGRDGSNQKQTSLWLDRMSLNDAQLINANFDNNSGWTGRGLILDGVSSYVSLNKLLSSIVGSVEELTIEIYANSPHPQDSEKAFFVIGHGDPELQYRRNGNYNYIYGINISAKSGMCKTIVKKQDGLYTYSDGEFDQKKLNAPGMRFDREVVFGAVIYHNNVLGIGLSGEIYSIKIYNRALTEEEIQKNYEYEKTIDRTTPEASSTLQEEKTYGIGSSNQLSEEQLKTFRLSLDKQKFVSGLRYCDTLEVEKYTYSEILEIMETNEWKYEATEIN